jgi:hypothetical protein
MKLYLPLATLFVATTSVLNAQTERELGSHVHGIANLNVAIFDSSLLVELESPWDNMVGFEHAPNTDEQKAMIDDALKHLNAPDKLLDVQGGNCLLQEAVVESTLSMMDDDHDHDGEKHDEHHDEHDHDGEKHDEHHDEHDHDGEKHDEHHDEHDHDGEKHDEHHDEHDHDGEKHDEHHDDHDGHDHDEHDHDADGSEHSSVLATYRYECKEIAELKAVDVTLFSVWSGFEDIDVQAVGSKGQTQVELNPGNTMIDLSGVN